MPIQDLQSYVAYHTNRTPCECEVCSGGTKPLTDAQPHEVDLVFFKVSLKNEPKVEVLRRLVMENVNGEFCNLNLFDNNEHSYIEIGGWIGDQGLAMQLMGMGAILGLWSLMTPKMIGLDDPALIQQMAGLGLVSILPKRTEQPKKS